MKVINVLCMYQVSYMDVSKLKSFLRTVRIDFESQLDLRVWSEMVQPVFLMGITSQNICIK